MGSSNNPLSGLLIPVVLLLSVLYLLIFQNIIKQHVDAVVTMVIMLATMLACASAIASENIQDLKAGQMVGATPWKQQLMMGVGVLAAALILAPVLNLLFHAYGLGGVYPRPGMNPAESLMAPQAGLMATITSGVIMHNMKWSLLLVGMGVGLVICIIDEFLKRRGHRLPGLVVGLSIYLPPEVMVPVILGGFVNYLVHRHDDIKNFPSHLRLKVHFKHQRGVLFCCGMVAGSALMGVLLAIPFVMYGNTSILSIMPAHLVGLSHVLGLLVTGLICYYIYRIARFRRA
jgi:putative OPT family oligopeptide transporter